ncbi:MAG: peptidase S8 [Flavobacteriales bacterium CG_4_9_14_3_um_filter_32_8]|nr:MAG: peptidase S8 [Flavobacteriales bacterium CG_4_9_14_3_um_filter_32_8]
MAIKKLLFIVLLVGISPSIFSQQRYAVTFSDKNNSSFSINNPLQFLSQKAIDRRAKSGITIKAEDLPVNQNYIDSVVAKGAIFYNKSKWMNLIVVKVNDTAIIPSILNLPFVSEVTLIKLNDTLNKSQKSQDKLNFEVTTDLDYGFAADQINIMEGEFLHNLGYQGDGMVIAVLDAGFTNVNTISAFNHLWSENRILGYWDFVNNNDSVFDKNSHGTAVLSTMAGIKSGEIIGTAPKASYWLLRSEDAPTETISEEYNWLAAAEFADSVGTDVINSSLGYTTFDNPLEDHTYADMDGNTTIITKAADLAFSKGMLVVNSAGNSGNSSWFYIGAPADGKNVLSVGAVDHDGSCASFSSRGPTADGRVKPNVTTIGRNSAIVNTDGNVVYGSGTSFSSPEMAGMAASLWQAFPTMTNAEIKDAIEISASQYFHPDDKLGYGIPNFRVAYLLLASLPDDKNQNQLLNVFPQPFNTEFNILYYSAKKQTINIRIVDVVGKIVYSYFWDVNEEQIESINLTGVFSTAGVYTLQLIDGNDKISQKIIKQ